MSWPRCRVDPEGPAREAGRQGFQQLGLLDTHLATLARLPPVPGHKDPFDHLLIAQAITEGAAFLSADRFAPAYPVRNLPCTE